MLKPILGLTAAAALTLASSVAFADLGGAVSGGVAGAIGGAVVGGPVGAVVGESAAQPWATR